MLSRTLSPAVALRVRDFCARVEATATAAERAALDARGNLLTRAFNSAMGTTSTVDGLELAARSARTMAAAYLAKAQRLQGDAEALAWLKAEDTHGLTETRTLADTARRSTITGAAAEVGGAIASDVGSLAQTLWAWAPWVLLAVAAAYMGILGNRLRALVGR